MYIDNNDQAAAKLGLKHCKSTDHKPGLGFNLNVTSHALVPAAKYKSKRGIFFFFFFSIQSISP